MVDETIKKHGCHITYVLAEKSDPAFCYSTGLFHNFEIPELFISALPQNLSTEIVNSYQNRFSGGKEIRLYKKLTDIIDLFPVVLIEVERDKLKEYVLSSFRFYGEKKFKYLQCVYPDVKGNFPNDDGYDYDQDVLGDYRVDD